MMADAGVIMHHGHLGNTFFLPENHPGPHKTCFRQKSFFFKIIIMMMVKMAHDGRWRGHHGRKKKFVKKILSKKFRTYAIILRIFS